MKPIFYSLFFILSLILVGCEKTIDESELVERKDIHYQINSDKPLTGSVFSYHDNGQVKTSGTYKKGLKEGLFEEFYDNGQLEKREVYESGILKDFFRYSKSDDEYLILSDSFSDDGWTLSENSELIIKVGDTIFRGGEIEGDGIVKFLKRVTGEPFTGFVVSYHDNGLLDEKFSVKDGKYEGPYKQFHENGTLNVKTNFENGLEEGPYKEFHENGTLKTKVNFKNGLEEGQYEEFYEDGSLYVRMTLKNGKRDGLFQWFVIETGSIWGESCHQNGETVDMSFCEGEQNSN